MEKQDIPNKEDIFKFAESFFAGLFWIFISLSICFSLLMVTYLLALNKDIYLVKIGLFIFKGFISSS